VRVYVDSSVVLRHILNDAPALGLKSSPDMVGSSDLLIIECQRVLQRERMAGHLDDKQYSESVVLLEAILDRLSLIEMGPAVKRRAAGPFPTVIGTLDAIHLASALLWKETEPGSEFAILTHDVQLGLCARAMGIRVSDGTRDRRE
jgi:predicted nucleic acid-binding protein